MTLGLRYRKYKVNQEYLFMSKNKEELKKTHIKKVWCM